MRVLVLDEGFISGTVTARGLRRAGCTVDVIAATGGSGECEAGLGTWSLAPRIGDPRLLDAIDAAVARSAYDVIYPVTEPLQWLIWDSHPEWERLVYPKVDHDHRAARRDKRAMSALAARAGVRTPREMSASNDREVADAVVALGLPVVIKGSTGRGGNATHICDSHTAARLAAHDMRTRGIAGFAQEYVHGTTHLVGGLFDDGRPLRLHAGEKTLQYPPRVGPAAEILSVADDELIDVGRRVFAAASVTGLASIDVVRDADGHFHFLELNPRPWGSIDAAREARVQLFGALVQLWRQFPVEPSLHFEPGVRTPVLPLYLLAVSSWRAGEARRAVMRHVRRAMAVAREEPVFAGHVAHRLMRVGLNW